jgi:hypothetical protein
MRSFTGLMGAEGPWVVFQTAVVLLTIKFMFAGNPPESYAVDDAVNG